MAKQIDDKSMENGCILGKLSVEEEEKESGKNNSEERQCYEQKR